MPSSKGYSASSEGSKLQSFGNLFEIKMANSTCFRSRDTMSKLTIEEDKKLI